MLKVIAIIGARPQFIKHFPLEIASKDKLDLITIHTGQHYDENMSKIFFEELGMTKPKYLLEMGGGAHGEQTGKMLIEIEKILIQEAPQVVAVYGDTNSTLAGALAAVKLKIPIVHIEAGLRSYNREMPEEINRILTDHISTLLFVPSQIAQDNLKKEGLVENVFNVGDIMKDLTLKVSQSEWFTKCQEEGPFLYVTLHRPYNTDSKDRLEQVLTWLEKADSKVVFAIHPRTKIAMEKFGINEGQFLNIKFIPPQSYFSNIGYLVKTHCVITDSGGMQKEAYWLKKRCITVRSETEWVETLQDGANQLVFEKLDPNLLRHYDIGLEFDEKLYGNGFAAQKMVDLIISNLN